MNQRDAILGAVMLLFFVSGCSHLPRATEDGHLKSFWSQISTKDYIRTRGVGAVAPGIMGQTARRGSSRNAALVSARYELLAAIKGVKLEGGVSIAQLMDKSSVIREIANELVKGGEEVQTEWLSDGGAVVTLELKRSTVERLIQRDSPRERALTAEIALLKRQYDEDIKHVFDVPIPVWTTRYIRMTKLLHQAEDAFHSRHGDTYDMIMPGEQDFGAERKLYEAKKNIGVYYVINTSPGCAGDSCYQNVPLEKDASGESRPALTKAEADLISIGGPLPVESGVARWIIGHR